MPQPRVVNVQLNPREEVQLGDYDIRILAEGDSWFAWSQLNLVPASNLLQQLDFDSPAVVVNYAYSGDTLRRLSDFFRNGGFFVEMRSQRYDAILLSGGGNDVIDALPHLLQAAPAESAFDARAYIQWGNADKLRAYLIANYQRIIEYRAVGRAANAETPVVLHTYDYPMPRNAPARFMGIHARGPWLLPALHNIAAPQGMHFEITRVLYDFLAQALLALADPVKGVLVVDTRGTLIPASADDPARSGDWQNEIHPTTEGYSQLAWKIGMELAALGLE